MKEIPEEYAKIGELGVAFIKQLCETNDIEFIAASKKEDLRLGIDCYVDGSPTDVKNTEDIYVCQIMLETNTVNVRHPFKEDSQATHYAVCKVKGDITKGKFIEHVDIEERLLRDFIKNKKSLTLFKQVLFNLQDKRVAELGLHLNHACINIKSQLTPFLKENIGIGYEEPQFSEREISFKIYKKRKSKDKGPVNLDVKSILTQFKSSGLAPVEEIITIKI